MNYDSFPYEETVGLGEYSETIIITTGEEMLDFLRSDDSLMVYSNTQELVAMANIYNININIFTYGESENKWTEISPDPMPTAAQSFANSCPTKYSKRLCPIEGRLTGTETYSSDHACTQYGDRTVIQLKCQS